MDFRLSHETIGIILWSNFWAVGWSDFLGVLYGENRPKSENWATLMPRSSATVRRTKKLTDLGNSLAPGLQRGINSISLQCIPWPVACSEWGTCLTPQSLGFWEQMTPEWKLFINFCPKSAFHPWFTCRGQIWRKLAVEKLPKSRLVLPTKKHASGTLFSPPFRPHLANHAQNFVNVVSHWPVHVYWLWSGSAAVCWTYSRKSTKKSIQYKLSAYNKKIIINYTVSQ